MPPIKRLKAEFHSLNRLNPNITVFIAYGLLYDVFLHIYKPFAIKFLERLGGTEFHIALLSALPGFGAALALLPGAILIGRRKSKQKLTSAFFLVSRFFILLIAFVPAFPAACQPLLFILFLSFMNLPEAVAQTSVQSFLGVIFDGRVRATAIALRNKFGNIAVPAITLLTGLIIGILPQSDAERIIYYQGFYVAAFIISLIEIGVFKRLRELPPKQLVGLPSSIDGNSKADRDIETPQQPHQSTAEESSKVGLKAVFQIAADSKFRHFMFTTLIFQFFWQAGWPLTAIYQIKTLGANELWLAMFAVGAGIASFLSAGLWSKVIYKRGNGFSLVLAAFLMSLNMFFFALAPNLPIMFIVAIYSGAAVVGMNISLLNGMLEATPTKNRIIAIAFYNTFANISLFLSPFFSNMLLQLVGIVNSLMLVGVGRTLAGALLLAVYLCGKKRKKTTGEKPCLSQLS